MRIFLVGLSDAFARYLREDNANIGAPYETSVRTVELVDLAHERAAAFLGCSADEVAFGQSMTALNFLLTRAFARTLRTGDEVVVTRLDHDANVSPCLITSTIPGIVEAITGRPAACASRIVSPTRRISPITAPIAWGPAR